MHKKYDIFGIGNALVDFSVEVNGNVITELGLIKGQSNLVSEEKSKKIIERIKYANVTIVPAGSAANTIITASMLGARTAFAGKVGDDEYGQLYEKEFADAGVETKMKRCSMMTGHVIVLITPDADRTFAVNLGASAEMKKHEVDEADIKASNMLHVEGYLLEQLNDVCIHAIQLAKKSNIKISLDVSDPGIVERNKELLLRTIKHDVDILFANEAEARVLTQKEPEDALNELAQWCDTVAIKLGEKGSLIYHNGEMVMVDAVKVKAVDTTGAGDAYAAGILYGLANNMPMQDAGMLASKLGAKVGSQIGARLEKEEIDAMQHHHLP
ncbi:adenosine kinase [Candidatus Woesearchaeota archaeon]|nr:adenosine kinase [Candidatus Woesearchaeota archaeon]